MKIEFVDKCDVIFIIQEYLNDAINESVEKNNKEYTKGFNEALLRILDEVRAL